MASAERDSTHLYGADPRRSVASLRDHVFPGDQRKPGGPLGWLISAACIALMLITLWMGIFGTIGQTETNALHLLFTIPLVFLLYPASKKKEDAITPPSVTDIVLAVLAAASFGWALYSAKRFSERMIYVDDVELYDFVLGSIAIVLTLEATRRALDMAVLWMTVIFGAYALTGPWWPGLFEHKGVGIEALVEHLYLIPEGLFNVIMTISATFMFTFLLFGALLQVSGGERAFMDLAMSVAGHRRGGPAKVATIASALMGTISGSTVSNVVTTGSLTIPLMKRIGYKPVEAAAIETVAGVGGALMPPVMGAGVFLMAALTGVPLITIIQYSVAPAVLYYASLYFYVDIKARKNGLMGLPRDQLPSFLGTVRRGGHLFIPIAVLIYLMVIGFTPYFASSVCVILIFLVGQLRRETRLSLGQLLLGLEAGARGGLTISALSAASALMFGVMTITALLVKATSIFLSLAGGSVVLLIILIGIASYIVGLGLPVTATYVIVAALGAGALGELGVGMLAAHLIIFWNAQNATISPPVALTSHVAATIARADPQHTSYQAVVIAATLYIIPFFFHYGSFLDPNWVEILFDTVCLGMLLLCLPLAIEGFARGRLTMPERAILGVDGVLFGYAALGPMAQGWPYAAISLIVFAVIFGLHLNRFRTLQPAGT